MEVELARTRDAKGKLEELAEDKLCDVCMDGDKCIMFELCRHVCVCEACAPMVDKCPLCRQTPTRKVAIYL